ncbi:hypothetical protein Clacol_004369 [Clathrus columnatus]|uniref:Uncharacterized protein n=1 Tax=Clathrus columnatus TaxID=1419009 RepID=A0AAV5A9J0_9AGAM|nr:hypothetical protein Clacol_004369 [Clathrus columnatus]
MTVLSDILAFLAVIYQIWSLWKEKRRLHLHTEKDFIALLLQQVNYISVDAGSDMGAFQNALSVILICEFTLDLRRRNTPKTFPTQSAVKLPDLNMSSFQNNPVKSIQHVLGRLQESIITDMGERRDDQAGVDGPGEEETNSEIA